MDQIRNEYHLKSVTGITELFVQSVVPAEESAVIGVLEIVHGMAEHTDRYLDVGKYLCGQGYFVIMHDHAGHGRSVKSDADDGYFANRQLYFAGLVRTYRYNAQLRQRNPCGFWLGLRFSGDNPAGNGCAGGKHAIDLSGYDAWTGRREKQRA